MNLVYGLLILTHILAAFAWFGLSLRLQALTKFALTDAIADAGRKAATGMTVSSVLLWATGLIAGVLSTKSVFHPDYPYSFVYTTSTLLILALVGVQVFGISRAWKAFASGAPAKKVMMWIGIGHLLWFVTLVLMLWPDYFSVAFA
jgi:hypothetical protein